MPRPPAVIHLIGHPGVGKYTVAKVLVAAADGSHRTAVLRARDAPVLAGCDGDAVR